MVVVSEEVIFKEDHALPLATSVVDQTITRVTVKRRP